MHIRPFEERDEEAVIGLWRACGLTRPWNDPRKDIARKLTVQREWFLVGEEDGAVIATVMAGYEGHRGWVNYLAVSQERRKQGLGAAMMRHVEALLRDAGCPKINLQMRADNRDAADFYRRAGYAEDAVVSFGKRLITD